MVDAIVEDEIDHDYRDCTWMHECEYCFFQNYNKETKCRKTCVRIGILPEQEERKFFAKT